MYRPFSLYVTICCGLLASGLAVASKPHVVLVLADDYGHGNLGYNRRGHSGTPEEKQGAAEVHSPTLDALVDSGIYLAHHYAYKICSPSRSSLQSGRLPVHVNTKNTGVTVQNPNDPVSGYAGIPRNMTGFATKLREAGYRTHMVGKWDAGMATPEHTPLGRGYETWLGYYQHANDYWRKNTPLAATGEIDNCLDLLHDFSNLSSAFHGGVQDAASLSDACRNDPESDPACYEEHLFKERALEVINKHDLTKEDNPLFLFYAFHLLHTPLQVPVSYLNRVDELVKDAGADPIDSKNRRLLSAMILYVDDTVNELVKALKARNMWDNTLFVFIGDNGGAIYEPAGGNNYPLKGAKFNDWEGGVRTNAFLAGGFVPPARRGTKFEGVISIADWYATFVELAGSESTDHAAIQANIWLASQSLPLLPPIDSIAQWGFILNNTNGRAAPLHLSENAVLQWPYKLVTGKQPYSVWQGAVYPNCTTWDGDLHGKGPMFTDIKFFNAELQFAYLKKNEEKLVWTQDCQDGCLVNVEADPTEHVDLAKDPAFADKKEALKKILADLNKDNFDPDRGQPQLAACEAGLKSGGFLGPFAYSQDWYTPVHLTPAQMLKNAALNKVLTYVNNETFEKQAIATAHWITPSTPFKWIIVHGTASDKCLKNESSTVSPEIIV